jgi:hypothetical protein
VIRCAVAAAAVFSGACAREPVGECPDIGLGDLVATEFRGEQDPDDSLGIWLELNNTTSGTLDLEGIKIRFRKFDGSDEVPILVRRSLTVPAGGYVVLGLVADQVARPEHIDYGFSSDYHQSYLPAAAVDIEACGTLIDRARYENLPLTGTYSFGGTPTSDNNDVLTDWCVNADSPGTPKAANPPCPP